MLKKNSLSFLHCFCVKTKKRSKFFVWIMKKKIIYVALTDWIYHFLLLAGTPMVSCDVWKNVLFWNHNTLNKKNIDWQKNLRLSLVKCNDGNILCLSKRKSDNSNLLRKKTSLWKTNLFASWTRYNKMFDILNFFESFWTHKYISHI